MDTLSTGYVIPPEVCITFGFLTGVSVGVDLLMDFSVLISFLILELLLNISLNFLICLKLKINKCFLLLFIFFVL